MTVRAPGSSNARTTVALCVPATRRATGPTAGTAATPKPETKAEPAPGDAPPGAVRHPPALLTPAPRLPRRLRESHRHMPKTEADLAINSRGGGSLKCCTPEIGM